MTKSNKANSLQYESSPYLLQHAYNPVNWIAWNANNIEEASRSNKLLIISIGYSSCHWCHVMERESFEDQEVAEIMNNHFVNFKVDREERPDVDMLYMAAVQIMNGQGGWPLNCIALPDGTPIYGGTYFPKEKWKNLLIQLNSLYIEDPNKIVHYAKELKAGLIKSENYFLEGDENKVDQMQLKNSIEKWKLNFDPVDGGPSRVPKFPLPSNLLFQLRYAHLYNDMELKRHIKLTLDKMSFGGIYDHLEGGFARYSTDSQWKIPHFEKMLYDNAQMISLYAEAYIAFGNEWYKEISMNCISFLENKFQSSEGLFYSALDADSEGEEGRYYTWTKEELCTFLSESEQSVFFEHFRINTDAYWEDDRYILWINGTIAKTALNLGMVESECQMLLNSCRAKLLYERKKRISPGLDDKCLSSWNSLMLSAYCNAYKYFSIDAYKEKAIALQQKMEHYFFSESEGFKHTFKSGKATIDAFFDDISFYIEALLNLYEVSGSYEYLSKAEKMTNYCDKQFKDESSPFYFYTPSTQTTSLVRQREIMDNVIPGSNSQMARNIFRLGSLTNSAEKVQTSERMINKIAKELYQFPSAYSHWGLLALELLHQGSEIAIVGKNVDELFLGLNQHYLPCWIFVLSSIESTMPLLKNRFVTKKTLIYVCKNKTCQLPVEDIDAALKQLI